MPSAPGAQTLSSLRKHNRLIIVPPVLLNQHRSWQMNPIVPCLGALTQETPNLLERIQPLPICFFPRLFLSILLYQGRAANLHPEASQMRFIVVALLLSAGSLATAQSNPSISQNPNPTSSNPSLKMFMPDTRGQAVAPALSTQATLRPNLNWAERGLSQPKPLIQSQLLIRGLNPTQLLALNQTAPQVVPQNSPRAKGVPIPTTFPDAHFESIPTTWPGLKFLLVDQTPPADKPTEAPAK
jgi:hypothetical protein